MLAGRVVLVTRAKRIKAWTQSTCENVTPRMVSIPRKYRSRETQLIPTSTARLLTRSCVNVDIHRWCAWELWSGMSGVIQGSWWNNMVEWTLRGSGGWDLEMEGTDHDFGPWGWELIPDRWRNLKYFLARGSKTKAACLSIAACNYTRQWLPNRFTIWLPIRHYLVYETEKEIKVRRGNAKFLFYL